jgi:hypothetical protein
MTNEERQKLLVAVRKVALMWGGGSEPRIITEKAADEIERLEKELEEAKRHTSAGLIEAAEWHEMEARKIDRRSIQTVPASASYHFHIAAAEYLRSRAADRSGPADYIPIGGAGNGA